MDERLRREWLTLLGTPGIGAAATRDLLGRFGSPAGVFRAGTAVLRGAGLGDDALAWLADPDPAVLERGLAWLAQPGHRLLVAGSEDFPPLLERIPQPPAALFLAGDPGTLWLPQVAIVGSRNATRGGLEHARAFSRALAGAGLTVTSGLALGVDGAAHRGALDAGALTVAVLGCGLDVVYPARHRELAALIREQGALISEYAPGTPPLPGQFPARNRLIAGLSTGVLVVEASVKSGSLITARQALEQGREVFAIPGSIHNPLARGCHALIKGGAKLVETADDVLSELGAGVRYQVEESQRRLSESRETDADSDPDPDRQKLLDCMGFDPIGIDQLVRDTGLTVDVVSSMLLILELDGRVESGPGGSYCRIGEDHR